MKRIIVSLILLILTEESFACAWSWGNGGVLKKQPTCLLNVDHGPSQFSVNLPKTFNKKNILTFELKIKSKKMPSAIELRLVDKAKPNKVSSHQMSFYKDEEFNSLLLNEWNKVSLSRYHFNNGSDFFKDIEKLYFFTDFNKDFGKVEIEVRSVQVKEKKKNKGFVSLTFDDGYESVYRAAQIMKKYNLAGTAYIILNSVGKKGYLTKKQLCELKSWGWSLSYHHETPFTEIKKINQEVTPQQKIMKTYCGGADYNHLAYPLGKQNKKVRAFVAKYFKTARLASGGLETLPPGEPSLMRSINVLPKVSPDELVKAAKGAVEYSDYAIFMFHNFVETPKTDLDYSWKNFEDFIKKIAPLKSRVKTVPQVSEQF